MFGLLSRAVSIRMTERIINVSQQLCADSRALWCCRELHWRLGELGPSMSGAHSTICSLPAARYQQFSSEASTRKDVAVNAGQRLEHDDEQGTRLDAVFFRTVLVASVMGACLSSWMSGSGMYGSPSSHAILLKGPPYMRTAGLQRLRQCIECGQHQGELEHHAIPERLVLLLRTEKDLDVWRELCSTLSAMLDSPANTKQLATWGVCAILSDRLSKEDISFHGAADPLLQKLAAISDHGACVARQADAS